MLSIRTHAKIVKRQELIASGAFTMKAAPITAEVAASAPAAAPSAASAQPAAEPMCPSPKELWRRRRELWRGIKDWWHDAKHSLWELRDLIAAGALLWGLIASLRWMLEYLTAEYNVALPSLPYYSAQFFKFAEDHPVTFLTLDFGVAFVIGYAFLYLETIQEWVREFRMQMKKMRRRFNAKARATFSLTAAYQPLNDDNGRAVVDDRDERGSVTSKGSRAVSQCSRWTRDTRGGGSTKGGDSHTEKSGHSGSTNQDDVEQARRTLDKIVDPSAAGAGADGRGANGGMSGAANGALNGHGPLNGNVGAGVESGVDANGQPLTRAELLRELRLVTDKAEEIDIKFRVLMKKVGSPAQPSLSLSHAQCLHSSHTLSL